MHKKKILVDLDGVLNNYTGEFDENTIPEIKPGTDDFLKKLSEIGELYLFTTRNLKLSIIWLIDNNLDKYFKDVTNIKIPAFLYIDDRTVCFNGNFDETIEKINKFQVYWKTNNF